MDIKTYENSSRVVSYLLVLTDGKIYYNFYHNDNGIIALFSNQIEKKCYEWDLKKIEVYTHKINFDGYVLIEYFYKKKYLLCLVFKRTEFVLYWIQV